MCYFLWVHSLIHIYIRTLYLKWISFPFTYDGYNIFVGGNYLIMYEIKHFHGYDTKNNAIQYPIRINNIIQQFIHLKNDVLKLSCRMDYHKQGYFGCGYILDYLATCENLRNQNVPYMQVSKSRVILSINTRMENKSTILSIFLYLFAYQ